MDYLLKRAWKRRGWHPGQGVTRRWDRDRDGDGTRARGQVPRPWGAGARVPGVARSIASQRLRLERLPSMQLLTSRPASRDPPGSSLSGDFKFVFHPSGSVNNWKAALFLTWKLNSLLT